MPIDVKVPANIPWTNTGVLVEEGQEILIAYKSGTWTCNPESSSGYDADGFDGHPAKPGYVVPDANEGGLVGKVGERTFWIGRGCVVPEVGSGNLFLGINDDQQGEYGAGYADNRGELTVRIVVTDVSVPVAQMLVDADRNGALASQALEEWTQGPNSRGAILIPNESGDAATRVSTPLVFRIAQGAAQPVRGRIEVDAPARIRVLAAGQGDAEPAVVLGQASPDNLIAQHELDLVGDEVRFEMEATRYLRRGDENPFVTLTFTPSAGARVGAPQQARLRVAPWLMGHHGDAPERVYVAGPGPADPAFRQVVVDELQLPIQAIAVPGKNDSVFIQDGVEIGYARASAQRVKPQGLRSPVQRWSERMTTQELEFDVIQVDEPVDNRDTGRAFGNLEVTPPIGAYGLGRIYFSPSIGPVHTEFLNAQRVQRPFVLDASWLAVGHVDEVVCFLPLPGQRAVALIPSPRLAYRLICETATMDPGARLLVGRRATTIDVKNKSAEQSLVDFLKKPGIPGVDDISLGSDEDEEGNFSVEILREFGKAKPEARRAQYERIRGALARGPFDSESVQWQLNTTVTDVIRGTFPSPDNAPPNVEIVEVPVLFYKSKMKPEALTANLVNMLVLGTRCLFPRPYGPIVTRDVDVTSDLGEGITVPLGQDVFDVYMRAVLARYGFAGTAIDTWDQYHLQHGEIHCATNVKRTPSATPWWTLPSFE